MYNNIRALYIYKYTGRNNRTIYCREHNVRVIYYVDQSENMKKKITYIFILYV